MDGGKYLDEVTGLYYNQARWYDPTLGRFISESPIAPFSEEEYVYCGNDPVNSIDINGLDNFDLCPIFPTINDHYKQLEEVDPGSTIRGFDPDTIDALPENIECSIDFVIDTIGQLAVDYAKGVAIGSVIGTVGFGGYKTYEYYKEYKYLKSIQEINSVGAAARKVPQLTKDIKYAMKKTWTK